MKPMICALLLLTVPAYADTPDKKRGVMENILLDLAIVSNGLWVYPDTASRNDGTRHFRFSVIPNEYTGSAMLEILIDAPEKFAPEPLVYKFNYDGIEYPIADNVYRSDNQYFVYLPELQARRRVEFSLGLKNTSFAQYRVTALLTVDNGQKSDEWVAWKRL
ncbi:MAG: hypothetical protein KUF77_09810 [Candidatus Thiodiazotropha sp. (ex Lucina aurantia)]|nr:hypothetical protein [Candidatus Thiodiazotropha taylori]MBV2097822.1 hypothetical protein [Candidatus Thiodiazotropha sp. (ex Codakia orbicularis)]MBV2103305.1 hypothetical protein [Candidatus Thiodiazotropha sp. (ex Lucina aurantia)]MBV2116332.1 hypothetical protein [Candidatus Thiodiazotropha sp. (ex Lucina aurantia)]